MLLDEVAGLLRVFIVAAERPATWGAAGEANALGGPAAERTTDGADGTTTASRGAASAHKCVRWFCVIAQAKPMSATSGRPMTMT